MKRNKEYQTTLLVKVNIVDTPYPPPVRRTHYIRYGTGATYDIQTHDSLLHLTYVNKEIPEVIVHEISLVRKLI